MLMKAMLPIRAATSPTPAAIIGVRVSSCAKKIGDSALTST
jgi:hypothetical protein